MTSTCTCGYMIPCQVQHDGDCPAGLRARIAELEAALADTTRRIDAMTEFVTTIMPYMEKLTEEIVPVEVTITFTAHQIEMLAQVVENWRQRRKGRNERRIETVPVLRERTGTRYCR